MKHLKIYGDPDVHSLNVKPCEACIPGYPKPHDCASANTCWLHAEKRTSMEAGFIDEYRLERGDQCDYETFVAWVAPEGEVVSR